MNEWMISFISLLSSISLGSMSWCSAWSLHPLPRWGLSSHRRTQGSVSHGFPNHSPQPPTPATQSQEKPGQAPSFTAVSFCIPSLPLGGTVWICPLELREGLGGGNPFSYEQEMGDMERLLYPGRPPMVSCCFIASAHPCWRTANAKGCL